MEMLATKYAVVRETNGLKNFSKWHETEEEAMREAERLCQKEAEAFTVLKTIGTVSIGEMPVKWVHCNGAES